jgi:hypothetical protein
VSALLRRPAAWLAGRSERERLLVFAAVGLTAVLSALLLGRAVLDDLAVRRARVAAHEHELREVRRLAAVLERSAPPPADPGVEASLLARLEAAAGEVVGRERIASMTPEPDASADERVSLQLRGATLPETVRLLHSLATASPPATVTGLALRKHPDDPTRFDATLEVAQAR